MHGHTETEKTLFDHGWECKKDSNNLLLYRHEALAFPLFVSEIIAMQIHNDMIHIASRMFNKNSEENSQETFH